MRKSQIGKTALSGILAMGLFSGFALPAMAGWAGDSYTYDNVRIGTSGSAFGRLHVEAPSSSDQNVLYLEAQKDSGYSGTLLLGVATRGSDPGYYLMRMENNNGTRPLFSIRGDGFVGIGTDNPQTKLHVDNGYISTNNTYYLGAYGYGDHGESNYERVIMFHGKEENAKIRVDAYGGGSFRDLEFWTGGNSRVSIKADGKVGIGTSNPIAKVEIDGTEETLFQVNSGGDVKFKVTKGGVVRGKSIEVQSTISSATIKTNALHLKPNQWSDFVFDDNYKLASLDEVEKSIKENGHLPQIPSEKEVKGKGIDLGEMQAKLLQKIEELTLYVIRQNKEMQALKKKLVALKER